MAKPLSVSKYAEFIITPAPVAAPSPGASKLLRQVCDGAVKKDETFTVTNSSMKCPAGANHLFALSPYWWEQPSGKWERVDGKRNPACDKPQGQKQLQSMAQVASSLAYGVKFLDNAAYLTQLEKVLKVFFVDPDTKMLPEVTFGQCVPGHDHGSKKWVITARYISLVSQALPLVTLSPDMDAAMKAWFKAQVEWMDNSKEGQEAKAADNNIGDWYEAIYVSNLFYVDPAKAVPYALGVIQTLQKHGSPETLFKPELERTRPRHYVEFTLEPIFIVARVAMSAGPNLDVITWLESLVAFAKTVPPGEIEVERDNDARYGAQIAWFDRMLARMKGSQVPDDGPDGSAWEGGWNQFARLSWALI